MARMEERKIEGPAPPPPPPPALAPCIVCDIHPQKGGGNSRNAPDRMIACETHQEPDFADETTSWIAPAELMFRSSPRLTYVEGPANCHPTDLEFPGSQGPLTASKAVKRADICISAKFKSTKLTKLRTVGCKERCSAPPTLTARSERRSKLRSVASARSGMRCPLLRPSSRAV